MVTVCKQNNCAGCMACIDVCPKGAITIVDDIKAYNAVIDETKCINCNLCHNVCAQNNPPQLNDPLEWYEGWVEDVDLRAKCSSGGFATAISKEFIKHGGVVCACHFKDGEFVFDIAKTDSELNKFVGSKYVKSSPKGIYSRVVEYLRSGKQVLFIGLPCQVAGVKNFVGIKDENLYTIDLICHGSPSPKIIEKFFNCYNVSLKDIKDISFRRSTNFALTSSDCIIEPQGVADMYTHAFMHCLDYTDNCYSCYYAKTNRCADITLGDSWGTDLPADEKGKGISLLMCNTQKGRILADYIKESLKSVNIPKAIEANHQLRHPSVSPATRERFMRYILDGKSFMVAMKKIYPKFYYKQQIKKLLIKLKIIHGGG